MRLKLCAWNKYTTFIQVIIAPRILNMGEYRYIIHRFHSNRKTACGALGWPLRCLCRSFLRCTWLQGVSAGAFWAELRAQSAERLGFYWRLVGLRSPWLGNTQQNARWCLSRMILYNWFTWNCEVLLQRNVAVYCSGIGYCPLWWTVPKIIWGITNQC